MELRFTLDADLQDHAPGPSGERPRLGIDPDELRLFDPVNGLAQG